MKRFGQPKNLDIRPQLVDPRKEEQPDTKSVAELRKMNETRPSEANPIPKEIIAKFGNRVGDIWWHAKGRNGPEGDPTIGIEVDGIRKTFGGYVWNEWWYFQKTVHKFEDPTEPNQCYWYRKRKVSDPDNPDEFVTIEEYVGAKLKDIDTGLAIDVPEELQHKPEKLCPPSD